MSRILVYCGFRQLPQLALPAVGVNAAPVQVAALDELNLLWSEVEWPFDPRRMQKSAVEFHEVVHQVFRQTAVIPFRLLSVFEDQAAFTAFAARESRALPARLESVERLLCRWSASSIPRLHKLKSIAVPARPTWSRKLLPCDLQRDLPKQCKTRWQI